MCVYMCVREQSPVLSFVLDFEYLKMKKSNPSPQVALTCAKVMDVLYYPQQKFPA
jgi:hypothetical protein